ncbi:CARD- and ANK-domain containing inflammasome adapter protein [Phytophthora ramorum]|uniref:CARD- and ANK-domain containing inflammasome adapter protein n=1 Tax=Phytophthora ramorum TaxID=164328 RepID=UPI0030B6EC18|nr:CARD- and ANK-domain containing inflammasome adapter protein [Phytophthora ramorum]
MKHAALWDQVQGSCESAKLQAALSGGADPSDLLDGWTPLHFLCENRSTEPAARAEGLRVLLHAGFDANAVDENGWSALHLLCKNKNGGDGDLVPSIQQLLTAKANGNLQTTDNKKSPLHFLCENEAVLAEALEALLKAKPDVNAVDEDGNTPLHYLAENSYVSDGTFGLLLGAKTNVNIQNHFQSTPSHYICQNSRVTQLMLRQLLKHKANFNIKNNIGNTPVHYLCENDVVTVDMLKELMSDKHVNVTIPNSLGKLASDYIPSRKQDCLAFLQKFAAPNLVPTGGNSTATAEIGGEDPSELPEPLKKSLTAWNASLPPFDAAFYNAVSCEAAFEAIYDEVQAVSGRACEAPGDSATFVAWETSLNKWRACILLAYAALVPPNIWHQYAEQFQRPVPSDLSKVLGKVEAAWKQFPEQTQRRGRFEALAGAFNA